MLYKSRSYKYVMLGQWHFDIKQQFWGENIKVNGGNSAIFIITFVLSEGQLLKERICF